MTTGQVLFYGGIIGAAIVVVVSVVVTIYLANGRKKLRSKFDSEVKK